MGTIKYFGTNFTSFITMENREIKFRAWDRFKKEMFEVYNLKGDSATGELCSLDLGIKKTPCSIQNVILMQFTGLKDKNGKKIYEGDILSYDKNEDCFKDWPKNESLPMGEVVWLKDEAGFGWLQEDGCESIIKDHIIIGNVYDNPELIKQPNEA